jgi:hypothetical protein
MKRRFQEINNAASNVSGYTLVGGATALGALFRLGEKVTDKGVSMANTLKNKVQAWVASDNQKS